MALTETYEYDCEVRSPYNHVQVRKARIIKDDGVEISRTYHRHTLACRDKSSGSWADTDISGEDTTIQAICTAAWNSDVKTAYETYIDSLPVDNPKPGE